MHLTNTGIYILLVFQLQLCFSYFSVVYHGKAAGLCSLLLKYSAKRKCTQLPKLLHKRTTDSTCKFVLTTSISANADELRDAASCKIDHNALPTKYNYQATSISR